MLQYPNYLPAYNYGGWVKKEKKILQKERGKNIFSLHIFLLLCVAHLNDGVLWFVAEDFVPGIMNCFLA